MDISLSQNLENLIKERIAAGLFKSMDDAINFAVKFTFGNNNSERIDFVNAEIEKGWLEMEKGQGRPYKDVFNDLKKRYE